MPEISQSKKMRALELTIGQPLSTVANSYAPKPLSYAQIASEWTVLVRRSYPEADFKFSVWDVWTLFDKHGVSRRGPRKARVLA